MNNTQGLVMGDDVMSNAGTTMRRTKKLLKKKKKKKKASGIMGSSVGFDQTSS
jgi:hypothetical protein